jgi:hypothetical protein
VTELSVPVIEPDEGIASAALKYAAAGWYVGPIHPDDRKNPGRVLGKKWPAQTSRDADQIIEWFTGTPYLLFLHVGRSDAWVADVDDPEKVPEVLADAIAACSAPYQESRPEQPGRGHHVFRQPPGRRIGNGLGALATRPKWGEGRGRNGVIIVEPSPHAAEVDGAQYRWLQTGLVPEMPAELAAALPDAGIAGTAATDAELRRFVGEHTAAGRPALLRAVLSRFERSAAEGGRHDALIEAACWAAREALAGMYSARDAFHQLTEAFVAAMSTAPTPTARILPRARAEAEAVGVIAWAMAQAETEPDKDRATRAAKRASRLGARKIKPSRVANGATGDNEGYGTNEAPSSGGSEGFEGVSLKNEFEALLLLPGNPEPLPLDALGPVVGPLAEAVSDCLQVPADAVINMALPLITTAARGGWRIQVDRGWIEPLALATLSALLSGEGKSPVMKLLADPLHRHEREARARLMPKYERQVASRELLEARVAALRKSAISNSAKEGEYLKAIEDLAKTVVKPLPRWLVDDITPEKAVSVLAEQGAAGAISAEPGLFGVLAGKYSANGGPPVEWFLKAYSGESIIVDRTSRATERAEHPALSVAACIQPGRLVELGAIKTFRDSGLLARLLYVVPGSLVGNRARSRPTPQHLLEAWAQAITALAAASEKRHLKPTILTVSAEGREVLELLRREIEPELHPDHGKYAPIADWMNKCSGFAIRIAGALTVLADPDAAEITAATMSDAVRLVRAYIGHAVYAFGILRPGHERFDQARQVLGAFEALAAKSGGFVVSRRDVHQKLKDRTWVESVGTLDDPIAMLVERGYLAEVDSPPSLKGGRPSPRYAVRSACPSDLLSDSDDGDRDAA